MITITAQEVRSFILKLYGERLKSAGFTPEAVGDGFDLLSQGIVDSLGILELISAIEAEFGILIDLEALDAEKLTILGPLCDYIGRTAKPNETLQQSSPAGPQAKLPVLKLRVAGAQLVAEIASTPGEIESGLRFRQQLNENEGMLFVFPRPQRASFWMKDCPLSLSIAMISRDGTILEIHDLSPNSEDWVRSASNEVRFALEVCQGWFQRHGLSLGSKVQTETGSLADRFPE